MDISFFWIAIGLAAFGYFIGEGLKNFGNSESSSNFLNDEDDNPKLVKEKDLHWNLNIDKSDVKALIEKYPDIPKVELNGNTYFPYNQLMAWVDKNLPQVD